MVKQLYTIFMTQSIFVHRSQSTNVFCRFIAILFAVIAASSADAQNKDYTNYVKLDSIVYPIYPFGPIDYKYEYSYDEDGNQKGFVRCLRNEDNLRENHEFSISGNGDITDYSFQSVNKFGVGHSSQHGSFEHSTEGNLLEAYERVFSYNYANNTTRTFDSNGRPLGILWEIERYEQDYHKNAHYFEYHSNGKLQAYTITHQNYFYDTDGVPYEFQIGENKYTFDTDGHLASESASGIRPVREYNVTILDEYETTFYYDAESKLIRSVNRYRETVDREDEDFINSLGGIGWYNERFNVWKESDPIEYDTKDTRDANGRLVLRETYISGTSSLLFAEEFSYDVNGIVISRNYLYNYSLYSHYSIKENYFYDDNGRLSSESVYLDDRNTNCEGIVYQLDYWYDEAGQRHIKEDRKSKTMPEPSSVKEFDNRGNLIVEIATTSGHMNRYEYTYDTNNNMTSVTRYLDGEFAEMIEYDTTIPSFKTGGTADIHVFCGNPEALDELRQAKYSDSHLFYLFDQPFKVKSYKYFDQGEVREVQLYYSKFIDEETAIENIPEEETSHAEYYDLQGRKYTTPTTGMNIIKKNEKAIKVFVK